MYELSTISRPLYTQTQHVHIFPKKDGASRRTARNANTFSEKIGISVTYDSTFDTGLVQCCLFIILIKIRFSVAKYLDQKISIVLISCTEPS